MRDEPLDSQAGFLSLSTLCLAVLAIAWTGCITQPTDPAQTADSAPNSVDTVMVAPSDVEVYPGDVVQFAAVAMLESGEQASVEFDWEATGGTIAGTGQYTAGTETGEFHVEATGRDDNGNGNGWGRGGRARVLVKERPDGADSPESPNQAPTPAFTFLCDELACSFDASGSSDADGTITGYVWAFGDDTSGSGETVSHDYGEEGTYEVRLAVTDDADAVSSLTHSVQVTQAPANQSPTAAFEHVCEGTTCSFDASASNDPDGSIASWNWELGDEETADGEQVEHTYAAAGTYEVRLTVMDGAGTSDSQTDSVTVENDGGEDPPQDPPGDPLDTTIYPGEDIQAAVDANPTGASFVIKAGVHRLQSVQPKTGNEFVGEPGAILSGAKLLTEFERDGGLWVATGQTQENPRHGPNVYGSEVCADNHPACIYPEDLFIDDQPLKQVLSKSAVGPGTFYFDYGADRIYFWDDPTGRKIEASATMRAFRADQTHGLRIESLIVEKYANAGQTAAIHTTNADDVIVSGNEVRLNHGIGIELCCGARGRMVGNYVHSQGQLGVAGWGSVDLVVEDNEIAYNHFAGYRTSWEAGGTKVASTMNLTLRNNHVHHNVGKGLWLDGNNRGARYEGNTVHDNTEHGIFHEISYDALIVNNTIHDNGWYGIVIDSSPDVEVSGNDLHGNGWNNGSPLAQILGRDTRSGASGPNGAYVVTNLYVHDNTSEGAMLAGLTGPARVFEATSNNRFRSNDYFVSSERPFLWKGSTRTLAEWQAEGQDTDGNVY